jgi:hypothetical protein
MGGTSRGKSGTCKERLQDGFQLAQFAQFGFASCKLQAGR